MKVNNKQKWIEQGYQMISENGFTQVKVEVIARALQKNKSSFYHYFGNWEGFEEELLDYHLSLADIFAEKIKDCESILPGMVNVFLDHKEDIFFHKRLRINRDNPDFEKCFERVHHLFEQAVLEKWKSFLSLENQSFLASKILSLLSENFLLKITYENYTYDWLHEYLLDVAKLLESINAQAKN